MRPPTRLWYQVHVGCLEERRWRFAEAKSNQMSLILLRGCGFWEASNRTNRFSRERHDEGSQSVAHARCPRRFQLTKEEIIARLFRNFLYEWSSVSFSFFRLLIRSPRDLENYSISDRFERGVSCSLTCSNAHRRCNVQFHTLHWVIWIRLPAFWAFD